MDKYTKTINELKKEYINLKLSNTHNKFSNNKLINGGTNSDNNATTTLSTDTTLQPINTDPSKKNKIIKGSTSMLDFSSPKVDLDKKPDYIVNFYYDDNLVSLPEENSFVIMGSMIFNDKNFIT